jgi:AI-2 transport protein TqsA
MIRKSNPVLLPLAQIMLIGGGFVLIVAGLRASAEIINILLLAYIITLIAAPIYRQFIRWHLPPFIAVSSVLPVFLILIVGLGLFLAASLGQMQEKLLTYEAEGQELALILSEFLFESGPDLFDSIAGSETFNFQDIISRAFSFVGFLLSQFANLFANFGLVILILFFALFEVTAVPDRLVQGLGAEHSILQRFYRLN